MRGELGASRKNVRERRFKFRGEAAIMEGKTEGL
ncbi:MAG: hypothetical protein DDT19_02410 [Syntrophomonadaceae bacterium]|nr:hypothetical protein [Bacillota bacterium]